MFNSCEAMVCKNKVCENNNNKHRPIIKITRNNNKKDNNKNHNNNKNRLMACLLTGKDNFPFLFPPRFISLTLLFLNLSVRSLGCLGFSLRHAALLLTINIRHPTFISSSRPPTMSLFIATQPSCLPNNLNADLIGIF